MSRWLAITVLVFMSVLGVASVAGCGGSGIPDDVEWDVVDSSDRFTVLGMGNVGVGLRVRISREVSEDRAWPRYHPGSHGPDPCSGLAGGIPFPLWLDFLK